MYIQGRELSFIKTTFLIAGIPVLFESIDFKIKEAKTQNWANAKKAVSVTYGKEEIESINIKMTQQQAKAIRGASANGFLHGITPRNFTITTTTGGVDNNIIIFKFDDFEFLNDGLDTATPDDPTMRVSVSAIASDISVLTQI
jgi:hypothetical protein